MGRLRRRGSRGSIIRGGWRCEGVVSGAVVGFGGSFGLERKGGGAVGEIAYVW